MVDKNTTTTWIDNSLKLAISLVCNKCEKDITKTFLKSLDILDLSNKRYRIC